MGDRDVVKLEAQEELELSAVDMLKCPDGKGQWLCSSILEVAAGDNLVAVRTRGTPPLPPLECSIKGLLLRLALAFVRAANGPGRCLVLIEAAVVQAPGASMFMVVDGCVPCGNRGAAEAG